MDKVETERCLLILDLVRVSYLLFIIYLLTDFRYKPFHVNTTKASAVKVILEQFLEE